MRSLIQLPALVAAIVFCLVIPNSFSAPATKAAAEKPAAFVEALKAGKKQVIVLMGTSLTAGGNSWSTPLIDALNQSHPGLITLHNEGVSASASSMPASGCGLDVLPKAIAHHPDVVFIEYGVNDAYTPYKITPADSQKNLNTIIDGIQAANAKTEIILQTTNAVTGDGAKLRPQLGDYFDVVKEVAKARKLRLIDHYGNWSELLKSDPAKFAQLVPDGVHPSQAGYKEVVLPVLLRGLGCAPTDADAKPAGNDDAAKP